jgi:hypothetical protein
MYSLNSVYKTNNNQNINLFKNINLILINLGKNVYIIFMDITF